MKKPAEFNFTEIGVVHTPFHDRFGVPRQPGLATGIRGTIQLHKNDEYRAALKGLEQFSHVWVVFVFHEHGAPRWKPTIRPPRLGGKKKVGVLASRSPHRPNPIGISAFKIISCDFENENGPRIEVEGVDLVDGTPVLDIKPYIPYADSIPDANAGWAHEEIPVYKVTFSDEAEKFLSARATLERDRPLIHDILKLDPRPAFQKRENPIEDARCDGQVYGVKVLDMDVHWQIKDGGILISSCYLLVEGLRQK